MIIKVDGWLYRVPDEAEFIEFFSSHERNHTGSAKAFDSDSQELPMESLLLPREPHWTKRVPA